MGRPGLATRPARREDPEPVVPRNRADFAFFETRVEQRIGDIPPVACGGEPVELVGVVVIGDVLGAPEEPFERPGPVVRTTGWPRSGHASRM